MWQNTETERLWSLFGHTQTWLHRARSNLLYKAQEGWTKQSPKVSSNFSNSVILKIFAILNMSYKCSVKKLRRSDKNYSKYWINLGRKISQRKYMTDGETVQEIAWEGVHMKEHDRECKRDCKRGRLSPKFFASSLQWFWTSHHVCKIWVGWIWKNMRALEGT